MVDENWAIGRDGDQFVRIKDDLKRFRTLTDNTILLYGRKTLTTFPGAKPLVGRENWLLSTTIRELKGARIFNDLETCLTAIKEAEANNQVVSCIGGSSVYEQFLPYAEKAYVTKVYAKYASTDRFFENLDEASDWEIVSESEIFTAGKCSEIKYKIVEYRRISCSN